MTVADILRLRLQHQHLTRQRLRRPDELVAWLGAVQAQDYPAAKWAVGQRLVGATDASVEAAVADGRILRTHVLRPTWHFVARDDFRWLLALSGPRVSSVLSSSARLFGLDADTLKRSRQVLIAALRGGRMLTRRELAVALEKAGIDVLNPQRLAHLIVHAELAAVVCSGAPRGRYQTYAWLEERVPAAPPIAREEALGRLTARYFTSHGPATLKDFVWWSGLTTGDAKAGIAMLGATLLSDEVDDCRYWWTAPSRKPAAVPAAAQLLPNFDEYLVGYADRSACDGRPPTGPRDNVLFSHNVTIDGRVVARWGRSTSPAGAVVCSVTPHIRLRRAEKALVATAVGRYARFLQAEVATVYTEG